MKWISVKEMRPVDHEAIDDPLSDVLIVYKRVCQSCEQTGNNLHYGIGYDHSGDWILTEPLDEDIIPNNIIEQILVTHWMPLPLPPENEE